MSTRSQMGIYEKEDDKIQSAEVFLYRHSDGYPESVLPEIRPFLNEFNKVRGISDTGYCIARLMQYLGNLQNKYQNKLYAQMRHTNSRMEKESLFLGYGIFAELHLDIEYFYHISPTAIKVYVVTSEDPSEWTLKKTVKLSGARKMLV